MRVEELDLRELLEVDAEGGLVRFAGQRALIFDAVAQGLLRRELIDNLGVPVARGLLSRFGYAHGKRLAESMRTQFKWDSDEEWRRAGSRIYALQGLFLLEPGSSFCLEVEGGTWRVSYEAEQHLLHLGKVDYPVCWTLCGLVSGYLSCAMGHEVYAVEDKCMGKGDPACHILVKSIEEWGDTAKDTLTVFRREDIDTALKEVTEALRRTEKKIQERTRKMALIAEPGDDSGSCAMVSRSSAMQHVMGLARRIAQVDSTVLITGESGTGKERMARYVHGHSARVGGPFVAINCAAISESLLESELFGHSRGSFTGAVADRPGLFEAANGGTLFLDEVGEIPLSTQVKLLRVLQEREVRRVGENQSRSINVRILTSTNRDLLPAVASKCFREDLFYRLRVVELAVPALRNRKEDILPLARILLSEASARMRRRVDGFTGPVADRLLGHLWPGNVRELANVMERAVAITPTSRVNLADLPPELSSSLSAALLVTPGTLRSLEEVEMNYIMAVLDAKGGNRTQAAATLRIGSATLHRKLKAYRVRSAGQTGA